MVVTDIFFINDDDDSDDERNRHIILRVHDRKIRTTNNNKIQHQPQRKSTKQRRRQQNYSILFATAMVSIINRGLLLYGRGRQQQHSFIPMIMTNAFTMKRTRTRGAIRARSITTTTISHNHLTSTSGTTMMTSSIHDNKYKSHNDEKDDYIINSNSNEIEGMIIAKNWKESPLVNPTIIFDTLLVPSNQLTKWITHPKIQHRLAKPDNWDFLKHVHPRIKLVQDYNNDHDHPTSSSKNIDGRDDDSCSSVRYKQLLLLPSSSDVYESRNATTTGVLITVDENEDLIDDCDNDNDDNNKWMDDLLSSSSSSSSTPPSTKDNVVQIEQIRIGPPWIMNITYKQLSFQYILKRLLPKEALPAPSSYEQIGHIAHFNLKPIHLPFKKLIGDALIESTSSSIKTVVNKVGQVNGKFRTYECEILADVMDVNDTGNGNDNGNDNGTGTGNDNDNLKSSSSLETTVVEDGVSIQLNVAECYWCTRLSGERQELIKDILNRRSKSLVISSNNDSSNRPLVIADVFCGTGAVCLLLAKKVKEQHKQVSTLQEHQKQRKKNKKVSVTTTKTTTATATSTTVPSLIVLANDWNPKAIEYMKRSIKGNGMAASNNNETSSSPSLLNFELSCRDSYDFISELGEEVVISSPRTSSSNIYFIKNDNDDASCTTTTATGNVEKEEEHRPLLLPDHVLMNYPLDAPKFLGSLRWWSWKRLEKEIQLRQEDTVGSGSGNGEPTWIGPRFHVYTFSRSSSIAKSKSRSNGDEEDMAINIIANELVPPIEQKQTANNSNNNSISDNTTDIDIVDQEHQNQQQQQAVDVVYRRNELNDEFNTDLSTRIVRDVAPGKVVVCVSFFITPKLIRYMQGDYS